MEENKPLDTEDFRSKDFVYCGFRYSSKKLWIAIRELNDDLSLGSEAIFEYKKNRDRIVGGIYRGASFSQEKIRGLDGQLEFIKRWHIQGDLIQWHAAHDRAASLNRSAKLEKDADKVREIEKVMKPLRVLFDNCRKRNDFAGMDALQEATVRALRTPLRKSE